MHTVYAVEGLDRLGKSTLINEIKNRLGFFQTIHFGKPEVLSIFEGTKPDVFQNDAFGVSPTELTQANFAKYTYQRQSFINSMILAKSGARIIFDRWHLGEAVYAPLYRAYDGNYVFTVEKMFSMNESLSIRLILLCEDFQVSNHFQSDGDSFDDSKRKDEQLLFIQAWQRSIIPDKKIVWVTQRDGNFRTPFEIFKEATA